MTAAKSAPQHLRLKFPSSEQTNVRCDSTLLAQNHKNPRGDLSPTPPLWNWFPLAADLLCYISNAKFILSKVSKDTGANPEQARFHQHVRGFCSLRSSHVRCTCYSPLQSYTASHTAAVCHGVRLAGMYVSLSVWPAMYLEK